MDKEDEVTMRLTITGLYPAIRKYYSESSVLPSNKEIAQMDQSSWENHTLSLHDLVDWLDNSSDVKVKIEVER